MANKKLILQQARKHFKDPPQLTKTERSSLWVKSLWAKLVIDRISNSIYKTGFILQLDYFV